LYQLHTLNNAPHQHLCYLTLTQPIMDTTVR